MTSHTTTASCQLSKFLRVCMYALFLTLPFSHAHAVPVAQPFGTFPKAVVFTGSSTPDSTISILIGNNNQSNSDTKSGFIMTPLGDGSWAVEAMVYPGTSYQYYFEFRVPEFETDSTASFTTTKPNGTRTQDADKTRSVTIPANATSGYVVYNAFGDKSVWGVQGNDTSLSITNPFLANWRGASVISSSTDGDTSGSYEGTNNYDFAAMQIGASKTQMSWSYNVGGDNFAPHVEGASRFDTTIAPLYGFQVLRAESSVLTPRSQLTYTDITLAVTGYSIFSDNDNDPWNTPVYLYDTSIVASPDSVFVYTVRFVNAYGIHSFETKQFEWEGGFKEVKWARVAAEVDGTVDPIYGKPIAEDPRGDQNYSNLDLTRMWVTRDKSYFYFALEIAGNIFTSNWGGYVILIDTTGDGAGALDLKSGSLGNYAKNVAFPNRKPEYALYIKTTNQSTGPPADQAELMAWDGANWSSKGFAVISRSTNNETSWIEVALPYFGTVPRIWVEAFSSGNDYLNPARDVINRLSTDSGYNEWNVTGDNWNVPSTAKLSVSTPFPTAILPPVGVTATAWDTRAIIAWLPPIQNPEIIDHFEIFIDSDRTKVENGRISARTATVLNTATMIETRGLVPNVMYYAKVFSVAIDGESVGSNIAQCKIMGSYDTIVTSFTSTIGNTEIEVAKTALTTADTFFYIEVLDYNQIHEYAYFTDTERATYLAAINAADEKIFFDPTVELISTGIYPDTFSAVRHIRVRRSDGTPAPANYFVEATLRIGYTTTDSTTVYSPGFVSEKRLIIRKLNLATNTWDAPNTEKTQWVQTESDRVVIVTSEFSIWNVLAGAGDITDFNRLVVYPNPFNAKAYIDAGHPLPARITFAFMPPATDQVEIFNIAGERVRTLNRNDGQEFEVQGNSVIAKWDAKNDYGRDVASGVYMFWIRAGGLTKIGKVAVIK